MSVNKVKNYLAQFGAQNRVLEFDVSSATVELAAVAVGVEPGRIAKTLSFKVKDQNKAILIVAAGDVKIDGAKFNQIGGVCPFDNPDGTDVYLDESLKRFDTVFPACGSSNSAIELSLDELWQFSKAKAWTDSCKPK